MRLQDITETYRKALLVINSCIVRFATKMSGSKHKLMRVSALPQLQELTAVQEKPLQTGKEAKEHKESWSALSFSLLLAEEGEEEEIAAIIL